ncbi:MAG: GatB/YqeY domain-containing protein [Burkholderiales bacterium]
MSLRTRVTDDMKSAMKAKDAPRLSAIRLLLAALKQKEVDERVELQDADVLAIIDKMLKQRRDSIAQYQSAGRQDLADVEAFEIGVLSTYMPQQLSDAEVAQSIADAIAETGAQGAKDIGKVMTLLKPRLAGKADLAKVSGLVKIRLAG